MVYSSLFDLSYRESVASVSRLSLAHITLDITISEDPNAAEVVKISTGVSYCAEYPHYLMHIRSTVPCTAWKYSLIARVHVWIILSIRKMKVLTPHSYNDAMATIRRVPSMDHNFQLVITRVFEEGNQELLEDEDESAPNSILMLS